MPSIYLDHAATCPCDPLVIEAMHPYFNEQFGNASSPHAFGRRSRKAIEGAREELALFIGAQPSEIIFTSGATEANNHAIFGVARSLRDKGRHLVVSAIEHHSILEPVRRLVSDGYEVSYVMPNAQGIIALDVISTLVRSDTILIAVGHANNEIGVIQSIEGIGCLARQKNIAFLVDAVQTVGHIPVNVNELQCDFLTLSAHKFYGPQGVGALYMRKGAQCDAFLLGGDQERSRRASTQNTAGIVGLGKAIGLCQQRMAQEIGHQTSLRETIIHLVKQHMPNVILNGHPIQRLPNNAHFSFENIDGEELIAALDMASIACSVGSACTSGQLTPSHVLKAIGLTDRMALGSLRVTIGRSTTMEHVQYFMEQLKLKVTQLTKV